MRAGAHHAAAGAIALAILALALPWSGWDGLQGAGPSAALLAGVTLAVAAVRGSRALRLLAAAIAAGAAVLVVRRLAAPLPGIAPDRPALVLALAAAAVVIAGGLRAARSPVAASVDRTALGAAWRALVASRALVWSAGVLAVLKVGIDPSVTPPPQSRPFGPLGNLLTAPASAWDGGSYLGIAQFGYAHDPGFAAFFPLYPALTRVAARTPALTLLAAIAVSITALLAALYVLHRLTELECGTEVAGLTVLLLAFSPMAVFLSAAYTESVFLALSIAAVYAARRDRWPQAGAAGALAALCRPHGVLVLVPLLVLYGYGPRGARPQQPLRRPLPIRRDAAWLLLVPAGLLAYLAYSGAHGEALAPFHAQETFFHRRFLPLSGLVEGLADAGRSLHQIAAGTTRQVLDTPSYQAAGQLSDPLKLAAANLTDVVFVAFAMVAAVGVFRRLPAAYGLYVVAVVAISVSSPPSYEPLVSAPRYLMVAFPIFIWIAQWARTPGRRQAALLTSAGFAAFFAAQFATWRWVA